METVTETALDGMMIGETMGVIADGIMIVVSVAAEVTVQVCLMMRSRNLSRSRSIRLGISKVSSLHTCKINCNGGACVMLWVWLLAVLVV